ncbi:N-acetylmuramoyl-L-alanine amidase [Flavobacterium ardleyense]|uniref:N-acetylmuramoyl-L-alanine amidase n=1 Tax=Flavobacterium ardleyense TaxID=2038737 RepID=A0ABW5ZB38_9FLAO
MKKIYSFLLILIVSVTSYAQVIYIDPGHGYGATLSNNPDGRTATEIETNLAVGLKLKTLLTNNCSSVIVRMSRTTNVNGWSNVSARALQAQNWNSDRLISIHCNADGDASNDASATSTATGTETYYSTATKSTANSQSDAIHFAYAKLMNAELALKGSMAKRNSGNPYLRDNLGILGRSTTACLNELGFVDNSSDKAKLLNDSWRDKFALGFYTGLKSNINLACNGAVAAPGTFKLTVTPQCNGTTSRMALSWTASANATSYDIYKDGALWDSNITTTTYTNTNGVVAGANHTYSVKAKNSSGTQTTNSNGTVAVVASKCGTPGSFSASVSAICDGATSKINLSWNASASATSYDVYRNGNLYASDITTTSFENTYLITGGTTFTYYVKAKNTMGTINNSNGTLSVVAKNCTTVSPFSLTLSTVCDGATSVINLSWTPSANATSYDIYRNGNLYASDVTDTSFSNTYLITAGTTFTYYVKAKNALGTIDNSNGTLSIKAKSCAAARMNTDDTNLQEKLVVSFYPNPTNGILNLKVNQDNVHTIQYSIIDINGRIIKEAKMEEMEAIDISNLPSSVYFIRTIVNGQEFVKQIIKE